MNNKIYDNLIDKIAFHHYKSQIKYVGYLLTKDVLRMIKVAVLIKVKKNSTIYINKFDINRYFGEALPVGCGNFKLFSYYYFDDNNPAESELVRIMEIVKVDILKRVNFYTKYEDLKQFEQRYQSYYNAVDKVVNDALKYKKAISKNTHYYKDKP